MMTLKSNALSTVLGAFAMAVVVTMASRPSAQEANGATGKSWQAVALGLVEPRSGEIKILASVIGPTAPQVASLSPTRTPRSALIGAVGLLPRE